MKGNRVHVTDSKPRTERIYIRYNIPQMGVCDCIQCQRCWSCLFSPQNNTLNKAKPRN